MHSQYYWQGTTSLTVRSDYKTWRVTRAWWQWKPLLRPLSFVATEPSFHIPWKISTGVSQRVLTAVTHFRFTVSHREWHPAIFLIFVWSSSCVQLSCCWTHILGDHTLLKNLRRGHSSLKSSQRNSTGLLFFYIELWSARAAIGPEKQTNNNQKKPKTRRAL